MKHILLIVLLGASLSVTAQTKLSLSYDDALQMLQKGNQSLKIADKGIETARTERDKLNALWYPSLQGAGTYVHMSEKIEVKQPLSQFTDPAKDFVSGRSECGNYIFLANNRKDKVCFRVICFTQLHSHAGGRIFAD